MVIPMKILYVSSRTQHFLEDIVYHGLITLFGRKSVVDYPPKLTYHCSDLQSKCECSRPALCFFDKKPFDYYKDLEKPNIEDFDLIVLSSIRPDVFTTTKEILEASKNHGIKTVFLDGEDDILIRYIYRYVDYYFKRETLPKNFMSIINSIAIEERRKLILQKNFMSNLLRGNYLSVPIGLSNFYNPVPLTFGIIDYGYKPPKEKEFDISFIATLKSSKLRFTVYNFLKKYVQKRKLNAFIGTGLSWQKYMDILGKSKISISVRGVGFDTYRYWEIPYAGAMLLSEKPDIIIPNNFQPGVNAAFFKDLKELKKQLDFYVNNDEALEIAKRGRNFVLKSHTSVSRAKTIIRLTKLC